MIELTNIEEKDLYEFAELAIDSFDDDKKTYGSYPPLINIERRTLRIAANGHIFKIVKDNKMVGGVIVFKNNNVTYTLGSIFIDPAFQNQGIGQQIILKIEGKFPNAKKWVLDTPYLSFRNHYFYEKMGYVKTGEEFPDKKNDFKLFLYEKTMK